MFLIRVCVCVCVQIRCSVKNDNFHMYRNTIIAYQGHLICVFFPYHEMKGPTLSLFFVPTEAGEAIIDAQQVHTVLRFVFCKLQLATDPQTTVIHIVTQTKAISICITIFFSKYQ